MTYKDFKRPVPPSRQCPGPSGATRGARHATPRTLAEEGRKESEFVRVYYIASSSFHRRRHHRRRLIAHISQCIFTQLRKPSEIEIEVKGKVGSMRGIFVLLPESSRA